MRVGIRTGNRNNYEIQQELSLRLLVMFVSLISSSPAIVVYVMPSSSQVGELNLKQTAPSLSVRAPLPAGPPYGPHPNHLEVQYKKELDM